MDRMCGQIDPMALVLVASKSGSAGPSTGSGPERHGSPGGPSPGSATRGRRSGRWPAYEGRVDAVDFRSDHSSRGRRRFRGLSSSSGREGLSRSDRWNRRRGRSPPRSGNGGRPPGPRRKSRRPNRGAPPNRPPPRPGPGRGGSVNRFPQAAHSPTSRPSSPVENRSGAPHCRHGRPRGAASSNRGRPSAGPGRPSDFSTYTVVVSHSGQIAASEPWSPSRNFRGEPQSSHSGPPSSTSVGPSSASSPPRSAAFVAPRWEDTVDPSTNANSFAQAGQVPVRSRTSCCSSSIEAPQSGHVFVMR